MMTMRELLADKVYRAYLAETPITPEIASHPSMSPQWVVYVQKTANGRWQRKSFRKYKKAHKFLWTIIERGWNDAAIHNRRITFHPPSRIVRIKGKFFVDAKGERRQVTKQATWKPKLPVGEDEEHFWCMACRRPTVWGHYSRHPAIKGYEQLDYSVRRCRICGGSERINMMYPDRRVR